MEAEFTTNWCASKEIAQKTAKALETALGITAWITPSKYKSDWTWCVAMAKIENPTASIFYLEKAANSIGMYIEKSLGYE